MRRRYFILSALACGSGAAFGAEPRRVVSLSPPLTEILYGIGAFSRVVAVTEYCTYPPEAKALPKVGGWSTPSVERVASFRPDLVVLAEAQKPFVKDQLDELGIPAVVVPGKTIRDVYTAIRDLGKATGNQSQAEALIDRTRARLERVRRRAAGLPHPTVLCIVDRTPGTLREMYAATQGSFLAELIAIAGGTVSGAPARAGYGQVGAEALLALDPDVILDLTAAAKGADPNALAWRELPELRAVRQNKVYPVTEEFVPHASQMIARTAGLFARLLHPRVPQSEWEIQ